MYNMGLEICSTCAKENASGSPDYSKQVFFSPIEIKKDAHDIHKHPLFLLPNSIRRFC